VPRSHRVTFGLETCMFSAHQMHPETALRLAASAAMEALARQEMSLQSMIMRHGLGLVIASANVEYEGALTFFSATSIVTDVQVGLRDDGKLLLFRGRHSVPDGQGIRLAVWARPVKLSGGAALDATPATIEGDLRARVAPDEIESNVRSRILGSQVKAWTDGAEELGSGEHPFFIGRSDCELADQWQFVRLASHVANAREQLAFGGARELSVGMKKPLQRFHGEYYRPMFLGDSGRIQLKAFRKEDRTYFVYRVLGPLVPGGAEDRRPLCALAVEVF
jgi:hypothetical protein